MRIFRKIFFSKRIKIWSRGHMDLSDPALEPHGSLLSIPGVICHLGTDPRALWSWRRTFSKNMPFFHICPKFPAGARPGKIFPNILEISIIGGSTRIFPSPVAQKLAKIEPFEIWSKIATFSKKLPYFTASARNFWGPPKMTKIADLCRARDLREN